MSDKAFNLSNALKIAAIIGILGISFSIIYYLVVFIPKREAGRIEVAKLEQEAKIEATKAEQDKLQKEQIINQQSEEKDTPEAQNLAPTAVKQSSNTSAREACLKSADDAYNKKIKKENLCKDGYYCDKAALAQITIALQNDREAAKNDCYRKYP
jgi:hypothetical protein